MTIRKMEQYKKIKNEIKQYEKRIDFLREKNKEIIADTVKGSSPNFPYTENTMTIRGYSGQQDAAIMRLILINENRIERLNKLEEEIENFIDTVDDSEIRQIIQLKYIDCKSWCVVARKMYGDPCEDRPRKKITRFFAEI